MSLGAFGSFMDVLLDLHPRAKEGHPQWCRKCTTMTASYTCVLDSSMCLVLNSSAQLPDFKSILFFRCLHCESNLSSGKWSTTPRGLIGFNAPIPSSTSSKTTRLNFLIITITSLIDNNSAWHLCTSIEDALNWVSSRVESWLNWLCKL